MSYKERVVTSVGYSHLGTEANDSVGIQRDIEAHNTVRSDDRSVLIPFHAVDRAVITTSMTDREDRNPYGCEADSNSDKVDRARCCEANVGN